MNNKERQLIIDSIHHWEKDIITYLDNKDVPNQVSTKWKVSGDHILTGSENCSLCKEYRITNYKSCLECLWVKYSSYPCYLEEYCIFVDSPTLTNAQSVVNKLWSIGLQDHSNKHFVSDYKYYSYN